MKPRHLAIQLLVLGVVFAATNVAVSVLSRNSVPRKLLRASAESPPATDLFLGNSLMATALDKEIFEAARPGRRALNLGLGSSSPVEHLLIFRAAEQHGRTRVYYGFFDLQLTDPVRGGWETLGGNRAMSCYTELETALSFYCKDDPFRAWQIRLVSLVPLMVERYAIWAQVEKFRRWLDRIGMPALKTNQFGRADDFGALEAKYPEEFEERCRAVVARKVPLNEPIEALFQLARERGIQVVIIEMPMPTRHRRLFYETRAWAAYRDHVATLIRRQGGILLPAADWIDDAGFSDQLHLNAEGAAVFSKRLALAGASGG